MLQPQKVVNIRYTKVLKEGGTETTVRTIIPTVVPGNIRALDVSDLDVERQNEVAKYYVEYAKYIDVASKAAFSFEDWLTHSKGVDFTPKWRTFKSEQTQIIT